jgi:hypothetical protein
MVCHVPPHLGIDCHVHPYTRIRSHGMFAADRNGNGANALFNNVGKVVQTTRIVEDEDRILFQPDTIVFGETFEEVMIARRSGKVKIVNPRLEAQMTRHLKISNDDILLTLLEAVKIDGCWTNIHMGQARLVGSLRKEYSYSVSE